MEKNELFLKTLFSCSACDGDIAAEEIELVKVLIDSVDYFENINVEETLNKYVAEINVQGKMFLRNYLNEISNTALSEQDQITLVDLAIRMIEADNIIQYSEVKFFKKIRERLSVSDEAILSELPNSEEYLLPDTCAEDKDLQEIGNFAPIAFN